MSIFDNSFRLEEFNALYSPNTIDSTNFILKLFLKFINDRVLLENTVKENDEKPFLRQSHLLTITGQNCQIM